MKKAPGNFEEEEDDGGDVDENMQKSGGKNNLPNRYQTEDRQARGMAIDQRGAQRNQRSSSGISFLYINLIHIYS
jgi:hypothetical protein